MIEPPLKQGAKYLCRMTYNSSEAHLKPDDEVTIKKVITVKADAKMNTEVWVDLENNGRMPLDAFLVCFEEA